MKRLLIVFTPVMAVCVIGNSESFAALSNSYQFNGKGNWSLDAIGSNNTPVGFLEAVVPLGSTVEKAFLYSSAIYNGSLSSLSFDGTTYNVGAFTSLGVNNSLQAYRVDVTSQVAAKIGSGSASRFQFEIGSESPNSSIDGEVLAIVYSNPGETERTIAFLDGFASQGGQTTTVNLSSPLPDPTQPGFEALMSLGIGYSYEFGGVQQASNVSVNGRKLTSSAGGEDDGIPTNGGLITVGGLDDSPLNPPNPNTGPTNARSDDELYNLAFGNSLDSSPFISQGDTQITLLTDNPSRDDNIFFLGLNLTARAGVDQPAPDPDPIPTSPVPEVGTMASAGVFGTLAGLAFLRRRKA